MEVAGRVGLVKLRSIPGLFEKRRTILHPGAPGANKGDELRARFQRLTFP